MRREGSQRTLPGCQSAEVATAMALIAPLTAEKAVRLIMSPATPPRQIRAEEPDRFTNQDWPNNQRKPLRPRAHVSNVQSGNQHSDPKQIPDKLNCSRHRHILAMQLALVNDTWQTLTQLRFPHLGLSRNWTLCFVVRDHSGQKLAYVYYEDEPGRRSTAKATHQRRRAANCDEHC